MRRRCNKTSRPRKHITSSLWAVMKHAVQYEVVNKPLCFHFGGWANSGKDITLSEPAPTHAYIRSTYAALPVNWIWEQSKRWFSLCLNWGRICLCVVGLLTLRGLQIVCLGHIYRNDPRAQSLAWNKWGKPNRAEVFFSKCQATSSPADPPCFLHQCDEMIEAIAALCRGAEKPQPDMETTNIDDMIIWTTTSLQAAVNQDVTSPPSTSHLAHVCSDGE